MAQGKKTGGRVAGVKNIITAELKDMILMALHQSGGVEYLKEQAQKNSTSFMTLIGKVLPTTLAVDPNNHLEIKWPLGKTALDE